MEFVLVQNRKPIGPFSVAEIRARIAQGEIDKTAQIWGQPWKAWSPITSVFPSEFGLNPDFLEGEIGQDTSRNRLAETPLERFERLVPMAGIKQILREAKEKVGADKADDIRLTAKDKPTLVSSNVREALSRGYISEETIIRATRDIEEVTGQRIFLYQLADHLVSDDIGLDISTVGQKLLGPDWATANVTGFPTTPVEPQSCSIRAYEPEDDFDARKFGFQRSYPEGWLLRIHVVVEEQKRVDVNAGNGSNGNHLRTVTYADQLRMGVCLMRYWAKPRILEIRVPNYDRRGSVLQVHDAIRNKIERLLVPVTAFHEWDLTPACTKLLATLVHNPSIEPTLKRVYGTLLKERDGSTMRIDLQTENTANLLATTARKKGVEEYLRERSTVESLNTCFQLSADDDELVAAISPEKKRNEVALRSISKAGHWDHVIVRLRKNS